MKRRVYDERGRLNAIREDFSGFVQYRSPKWWESALSWMRGPFK